MSQERIQQLVEKAAQNMAERLHNRQPYEKLEAKDIQMHAYTLFQMEPELRGLSSQIENELKERYQKTFEKTWQQHKTSPKFKP